MPPMNGANIIERFGGVRPLARLLGRESSTVMSWKKADRIPAQHQKQVLDAGRDLTPPLTPADFFVDTSPEPSQAPHNADAA